LRIKNGKILGLDLRIAEDNTSDTPKTTEETVCQGDIELGDCDETHLIPTLMTILIEVLGSVWLSVELQLEHL